MFFLTVTPIVKLEGKSCLYLHLFSAIILHEWMVTSYHQLEILRLLTYVSRCHCVLLSVTGFLLSLEKWNDLLSDSDTTSHFTPDTLSCQITILILSFYSEDFQRPLKPLISYFSFYPCHPPAWRSLWSTSSTFEVFFFIKCMY